MKDCGHWETKSELKVDMGFMEVKFSTRAKTFKYGVLKLTSTEFETLQGRGVR